MSKPIRIVRFSGGPADPEVAEAYRKEFADGFDAISNQYPNPHAPGVQETLQTELQKLEDQLNKKYSGETYEKLPTSRRAWKAMIVKYQAPVLVAQNSENKNEPVLVIMDIPLG